MSSKSSMAVPKCLPFLCLPVVKDSLHLVEHVAQGRLHLQRLFDFIGAHIGILAVFQEARPMVVAHEFDEGGCIRLPVLGETVEVFKNSVQARSGEDGHCVFGVFIEIRIEDTHILEVSVTVDFKEIPAKIVQLKHGKDVRLSCYGLLDISRVLVEVLLSAWFDLRDDGKAVARRGFREDRAVAALLDLIYEESTLGDGHG